MDTTEVGLVLEVRTTETIRPEVKDRAKEMLAAVLTKAGMTGCWRYDILMSEYRALPDPSLYRMSAALLGDTKSMLHIAVRSSLMPGGAVAGILRQTGFVDFQGLLNRLLPAIDDGNRSNWQPTVVREERTSMAPRGLADIEAELEKERMQPQGSPIRSLPFVDGTGRVMRNEDAHRRMRAIPPRNPVRSSEPHDVRTPVLPAWPPPSRLACQDGPTCGMAVERVDRAIPAAVSPPALHQNVPNGIEGETSMSSFDDEQRLERFLIAAVRGTADGVFSGKAVTPVVKEVFPERSGKGLVGGLFFRLEGLKWITRFAPGQYQLERLFLDAHQEELGHVKLSPRPALPHAKPKPRKAAGKPSAVSAEPAMSSPGTFEDWVKSLAEERLVLTEAVTRARGALAAFDERYRIALGPLHEQLYPVPPEAG